MTTTRERYEMLAVSSAMHRGLVTCRPDTPLTKVAQMMAAHRIHSVVIRSDETWGVVSDLDLARAFAAGQTNASAGAVASAPAVTIESSEKLGRAADLMVDHGVTHLVVVRRGQPIGVLSTLDLARILADSV